MRQVAPKILASPSYILFRVSYDLQRTKELSGRFKTGLPKKGQEFKMKKCNRIYLT